MKIPCLSLSLGQQGGIGLLPIIIKLDKWYAVSDSRTVRPSSNVESLLWYQRSYPNRDPFFHGQGWVHRKWNKTNNHLTWDEVAQLVQKADK